MKKVLVMCCAVLLCCICTACKGNGRPTGNEEITTYSVSVEEKMEQITEGGAH